ncbi:MAG: hypothetical protein L3J93_06495, partial [Thermoplasmata archaeon]|nr:hypothetical protein [Thermoplasmata archaeon]
LDIDFHQDGRTLFPGTGEVVETGRGDGAGLKVNVPLVPGSGDRSFLGVFQRIVPPLLDDFRPDLIVLQHGVDGHVDDSRAGLRYSPAAYVTVVETLLAASERLCSSRLLVTGGGGYTPANLCRVFARAGFLLAGKPLPTGATPASWQQEYRSAMRAPAPATWIESRGLGENRVGDAQSDRLVGRLEEALGRRFPGP